MTVLRLGKWLAPVIAAMVWSPTAEAQGKAPTRPPTHQDVRYGPHPTKNVFAFWQAQTPGPAPVLVSIHHGGFSQGQKFVQSELLERFACGCGTGVSPVLGRAPTQARRLCHTRLQTALNECLASGISVAAIAYRLTEQTMAPAQFHDSARAGQFLRSRAADWNIDPSRVAATGGSSGGGISLWLAFHDGLADPNSDDPVLRQSSRLTCAAAFNAQTSYDPRFIRKLFPGKDVYKVQNLAYLFRVDLDQIDNLPAEKYKLFAEVSPLTHHSKDDPPVLLSYKSSFDARITTANVGIHHPHFGRALKERMDELKVPCELYADGQRFGGATPMSTIDYLRKHFSLHPK